MSEPVLWPSRPRLGIAGHQNHTRGRACHMCSPAALGWGPCTPEGGWGRHKPGGGRRPHTPEGGQQAGTCQCATRTGNDDLSNPWDSPKPNRSPSVALVGYPRKHGSSTRATPFFSSLLDRSLTRGRVLERYVDGRLGNRPTSQGKPTANRLVGRPCDGSRRVSSTLPVVSPSPRRTCR